MTTLKMDNMLVQAQAVYSAKLGLAIKLALHRANGVVAQAARELGIPSRTLWRRLAQLHIDHRTFRKEKNE
jgi:transcriptional regulator of acetoin/glycerol metabolism